MQLPGAVTEEGRCLALLILGDSQSRFDNCQPPQGGQGQAAPRLPSSAVRRLPDRGGR